MGGPRPVLAAGIVLLLGACGGPSASAEPSMVVAPSVPPDWDVLEDEASGIQVAVPPGFARVEGMEGIVAQRVAEPGVFGAEVWARRAGDSQPEPPFTEEVVADWLEERLMSWSGGGPVSVTGIRRVTLPVGDAIEVRASLPGDQLFVQMVAYGIPTAEGVADLRIFASRDVWEESRADFELMALLFRIAER